MKKPNPILFMAGVLILAVGLLASGMMVERPQFSAFTVASATTDASALTTSTASWAVCTDWANIPAMYEYVKVCFYAYGDGSGAGDPCDGTFSYQLYAADYGSSAEIVASADMTVGALQLSHNPVSLAELNSGDPNENYCWCDTSGAITSDWPGGVTGGNDAGGTDAIASLTFARGSARKIWCRIYSISNVSGVYCVAYGD